MTNFLARQPGQPFEAYLEAALDHLLTGLRDRGYGPEQAQIQVNVTERSAEEIVLLSRRATELGLIHVHLVDDHVPARPGTTPRSLLKPDEAASMAEARAARGIGGQ